MESYDVLRKHARAVLRYSPYTNIDVSRCIIVYNRSISINGITQSLLYKELLDNVTYKHDKSISLKQICTFRVIPSTCTDVALGKIILQLNAIFDMIVYRR